MPATLPPQFLDMIAAYPAMNGLADALRGEPEISVRVNRRKGIAVPDGADRVPWCRDGFYLDTRPRFTFDPALHQGLYYVQDASSMILSEVVRRLSRRMTAPRYLDACAAPGGKTTAAIDALPDDAIVVANEYVRSRAMTLRENIIKWGAPNVIISTGDTARLSRLRGAFDIIAADVPCSGEGMMRKDAEAVAQWTPALIDECAARQREIVANLWPALRPGGYLVYSTCTFNRRENEEIVAHMVDTLGAEPVDLGLCANFDGIAPGIDTPYPCCRFMPHRLRGEGLFLAILRKPDTPPGNISTRDNHPIPHANALSHDNTLKSDNSQSRYSCSARDSRPFHDNRSSRDSRPPRKGKDRTDTAAAKIPAELTRLLTQTLDWTYTATPSAITAFPAQGTDLLAECRRHLDIIHAGVEVATLKGRDYIPSHPLAITTALTLTSIIRPIGLIRPISPTPLKAPKDLNDIKDLKAPIYPAVEVDYPTAIAYLRRESLTLPDAPRGIILLTYGHHPLGFAKNLGNRANNLYPPELRILSTHTPDTPPAILPTNTHPPQS